MPVSNIQTLERSYKNIVFWDFKEVLIMHEILGHYLRSISLIRMREMHPFLSLVTTSAQRSGRVFFVVLVYVKDIFNKYFIKINNLPALILMYLDI
jgi:hypothetical protein